MWWDLIILERKHLLVLIHACPHCLLLQFGNIRVLIVFSASHILEKFVLTLKLNYKHLVILFRSYHISRIVGQHELLSVFAKLCHSFRPRILKEGSTTIGIYLKFILNCHIPLDQSIVDNGTKIIVLLCV